MGFGRLRAAEIVPAAADQQPEGQCDLADESERADADRVVAEHHDTEAVGEVSKPGDHKQDAEDLRHETGSISQVADHQQVNAR